MTTTNTEETVTVVALVAINEDAPMELAKYLDATAPLLKRAGAKIVQRFTSKEPIVGNRPVQTVILVEYPNRAAVDLVFESAEYEAIKPIRDLAFSEYRVCIVAS